MRLRSVRRARVGDVSLASRQNDVHVRDGARGRDGSPKEHQLPAGDACLIYNILLNYGIYDIKI